MRFIQELLESLGESMYGPLLEQIRKSAHMKQQIQLIAYTRYLVDGEEKTSYVCMSELSDGTAKTITDTLIALCSDLE